VLQCHFIVSIETPAAVPLEHCPASDHAERVQLRRAQRPHAARAEHLDAVVERGEDLALPDRRSAVKDPVDQQDPLHGRREQRVDVALARRRPVLGWQDLRSRVAR
jgi:hypothetical protein